MAEQRKELKLAIKYEADTRAAQDANKKLAESMSGVAKEAERTQAKMKQMAGTTPGSGMGAPVFDRGPTSRVAAFDRPIPVVIVGPRPLPVAGFGGPGAAMRPSDLINAKPGTVPAGGMLGGLGELGTIAARIAAPIAAVAAAAGTVANLTKAIQELDHPALSARDKVTGLARAIPLLGDAIGGLMDNMLGAVDRIRDPELAKRLDRMKADQGLGLASRQLRSGEEMRVADIRREVSDAEVRARGYQYVGGQVRFEQGLGALGGVPMVEGTDPRMRDATNQMRRAQREVEVTLVQKAESDNRLKRLQEQASASRIAAEEAGMRARDAEARAGFGNGRLDFNAATRQNAPREALLIEQQKIQQALGDQQRVEKEMMHNKQLMLGLEQKRYELMTKETEIMKTRLSLVEQEENRVRAGTQQFGEMDVVTQQALLDALERFKKGGREAVTEGEYQAIRNNELSRGLVQQRIEQDQSNNPAYQRFLAMTGNRDLKVIEQERMKLEQEIKIKVELNEDQYQKMLAAGLKKFGGEMEGFVRRVTDIEFAKLRNDMMTGRSLRGQ